MPRALFLLLVALALSAPGAALAAAPRAELPDIEDEVMCPVCGTPLNLAGAPQAERERAFIRRLIAGGATKEQIKHALVEQYGPRVLALPQRSGFDLAAYAVPVAVVLAALALLAVTVGRWLPRRRRDLASDEPPADAPALAPADARRLDEDLARYDL